MAKASIKEQAKKQRIAPEEVFRETAEDRKQKNETLFEKIDRKIKTLAAR